MEVTPLDLRGAHVSSGDGAQPHGRDMSPRKQATQPSVDDLPPLPEYPLDMAQEHLAASLRRAAPQMDAETARKLAKFILESRSAPDPGPAEAPDPSPEDGPAERAPAVHVDTRL